ncbi:hypothetical protein LINGRAHAP2_LOCUS31250 [Linum grandiflorum]
MTINKIHAQALEQIIIYLPILVFSHMQLSVALSRVPEASGINIALGNTNNSQYATTRNIMYGDVFDDLRTLPRNPIS